MSSVDKVIRKILYDTGFEIIVGDYYQAMEAGWLEVNPDQYNVNPARWWNTIRLSLVASREQILFNLLESKTQRENSKRRYNQTSYSLQHIYENLKLNFNEISQYLGVNNYEIEIIGSKIDKLTSDYNKNYKDQKVDINSLKGGELLEEIIPLEYTWLDNKSEALTGKKARTMFYSILAMRNTRHAFAHRNVEATGYSGKFLLQSIDKEGINHACSAIFDILKYVNSSIFGQAKTADWSELYDWNDLSRFDYIWYANPKWQFHEWVWSKQIQEKFSLGKYNEAVKLAGMAVKEHLQRVYKLPEKFIIDRDSQIEYWKNPALNIESMLNKQGAWETLIIGITQNPPNLYNQDTAKITLKLLTDVAHKIEQRKLPFELYLK